MAAAKGSMRLSPLTALVFRSFPLKRAHKQAEAYILSGNAT
jgi:hypothetical protein